MVTGGIATANDIPTYLFRKIAFILYPGFSCF